MTQPTNSLESSRPSRIQIEVRDIPQGTGNTAKSQYGTDADGSDLRHSGDADGSDLRH